MIIAVTYRQFCVRVRKLLPFKPTRDELYSEWNRCLKLPEIEYARHALRIAARRRSTRQT